MKIIEPSYVIMTTISDGGILELKQIEECARVCYKSELKALPDGTSAEKLIKFLIDHKHEAMLEHSTLRVKFVCDRGFSHEMVRHRLCSFAQESTRYCNYGRDQFGHEITVIDPDYNLSEEQRGLMKSAAMLAEDAYMRLIDSGVPAQCARWVLPTGLKTEIVVTANYREWRHIFHLRCASDAHPDMRKLMIPLREELRQKIPIIFDKL